MGMGGIIDFLFLVSGAYLVGTSLLAKRQGNIVANVMLGKNIDEKDIQDKMGFIEFMYKRLLVAGTLIMAAAIVHLVNDYYVGSAALTCVGIIVMFIGLVIYIGTYRKGQKQYIRQREGNSLRSKINKK